MNDALDLMNRLGLIDKDAIFCYGMSKMTVANEGEESSLKYKRLAFVELLELIGRIADIKFKNTEYEKAGFQKRVELVLDDVLAFVDVKRKDIAIKVEDESESDDEY